MCETPDPNLGNPASDVCVLPTPKGQVGQGQGTSFGVMELFTPFANKQVNGQLALQTRIKMVFIWLQEAPTQRYRKNYLVNALVSAAKSIWIQPCWTLPSNLRVPGTYLRFEV